MAGRGRPPKDPDKRVRRNAPRVPVAKVESVAVAQPELPEFEVTVWVDGIPLAQPFVWPQRTRDWWEMWGRSPIAERFTEANWETLLDTAVLHARYWLGDFKLANELRLRTAAFGATPADSARLGIQFVPPAEKVETAATVDADEIMSEYTNVVNIADRKKG